MDDESLTNENDSEYNKIKSRDDIEEGLQEKYKGGEVKIGIFVILKITFRII